MEFERIEVYAFEAIAYLKDPTSTKSWENSDVKFSVSLCAQNLEDAIVLCRNYAKTVPVKEIGYHNSEWDNAEFCVIKSVEHKGTAYAPRRRTAR